jgi:hypothetical protein
MHHNRIAIAMIAVGLATGAAFAQSLPPGLLERAQALPAPTGAELQRHAAMLATMTPGQRAAFRQRVVEWDAQVPARQRERREAWQAWLALPVTERERLQAAASDYAALPVEKQQALRAQYDALDGSDQRGWLLGPVLGADYPKLHALVAQVPAAQRDALLAALRSLSPAGRADLAVLAQRTPPQARDALRTQLLAVPMPRRDTWLRERLDR